MIGDPGFSGWALIFVAGSTVLVFAGVALARAADEIATATGMGGLLVGMTIAAGATSLPEVVTVTSAGAEGAPDLAVGSVFGSSMANMAVLAVIDLAHRQRLLLVAELGHARVASVAIALTSVAVLGIATPAGPTLGWIGPDTVILVAGYAAAVAWIGRARRSSAAEGGAAATAGGRQRGIRPAVLRFSLAALAILASGPIVAAAGQGIADTTPLGETFVGVLLVAIATSLPELVASLGALQIGAFDLAVGNLFGSNAFNMATLFAADVAYVDGPLLTGAEPAQVVAGVGAIGLMAIALAALVHGSETRLRRLEPDAVLVLIAYVGVLGAVLASS